MSAETLLALGNAIYFKAGWGYPFTESATADGPFTLLDGSQVTVPLMHQETRLEYGEGEGYQAMWLPYGGQGGGHVGHPAGAGPFRGRTGRAGCGLDRGWAAR